MNKSQILKKFDELRDSVISLTEVREKEEPMQELEAAFEARDPKQKDPQTRQEDTRCPEGP